MKSDSNWPDELIRVIELRELLAWHSHELSQPIAAMGTCIGAVKMLLGADADPRAVTALDRGLAQIDRVRDTMATASQRFPQSENSDVDVLALTCTVADRFGLEIQANHDGPLRVAVDATELMVVLFHLLRNAVEADKDVASVEVTLSEADGDVQWLISNRAQSNPSEEWFEPFVSTKSGRLGLGLLMVKRLLARMNGSFQLDAQDGRVRARIALPTGEIDES